MSVANSHIINLNYGSQSVFTCEVPTEHVLAVHDAPESITDLADALRKGWKNPLDFPPIELAIVPDDRVVLAVDHYTPCIELIVRELVELFGQRGVKPDQLTILQGAVDHATREQLPDPRSALPAEVRDQIAWIIHDPDDESERAYLASTARGERIYLSRYAVEADFVLPVGMIGFDPILGYRGVGSVLFPGLSSRKDIERSRGQAHQELAPDDDRPLRQTIDEITWLLGIQATVQVIPSGQGGVAHVLAGSLDAVFRKGKELLQSQWSLAIDHRPEMVVAAIDGASAEEGWHTLGAVLATAQRLVARDGRIVVLSDLSAELGEGMKLLRDCYEPKDAIQPLRKQAAADLLPATQIASTLDWANVYLLSELEANVVEELAMTPIASPQEVGRLISFESSCVFLNAAQYVYAQVRDR